MVVWSLYIYEDKDIGIVNVKKASSQLQHIYKDVYGNYGSG